MAEPQMLLQVRIPITLLKRVDRLRDSHLVRPTRANAVRYLVESALDSIEQRQSRKTRAAVE